MGARYVTWLDGVEATVELLEIDGDTVVARIESEEGSRELRFSLPAGLGAMGGRTPLRLDDGSNLRTRVLDNGSRGIEVGQGDVISVVKAISERDAWLSGGADDDSEGAVTVAMPGAVVKVMAAVGDVVTKGQPLLIIEAMKMENDVKAGRDGVVSAVHVEAGQTVEADAILMEIGDPE